MLAVFQYVFFCLAKSNFMKLTVGNVILLISRVWVFFNYCLSLSHSHCEGGRGGKGENLIKPGSDFYTVK